MLKRYVVILLLSASTRLMHPVVAAPVIDGRFDDWPGETLLATDPAGDASSPLDITALYARNVGTQLYVRIDLANELNLQAGPGGEETLRLEIEYEGQPGMTVDLRNRTMYTLGNPSNYISWSAVDLQGMTTHSAQSFEIRFSLDPIQADVNDSIMLNVSGADALTQPVAFTLTQPSTPVIRRSPERNPGTSFRIGSLNTLSGGLLDAGRSEAIGRMVTSVAADIYCFQEQNSSSTQIADRMAQLNPLDNGLPWNIHRVNDTVIATQHAIIPLFYGVDAAAIVDFGDGQSVLVFSIHPPCCGYAGNGQDQSRIAEMQTLIDALGDLRAGNLGPTFEAFRNSPAIVVGDWNMVGSRTPLTLLEESAEAGLTHWVLPHLVGNTVTSWRSLNEGPGTFAPGLLDLLAYEEGPLIPRNGFVLDTERLSEDERNEMNLNQDDSRSSDHLFLVADFSFPSTEGIPTTSSVGAVVLLVLLIGAGTVIWR
ncbi:MAG: hypothetical protein ACPGXK_02310 [Phycisphaerae bacterium]